MPQDSKKETIVPPTTSNPAVEHTSSSDTFLPEASLPKLIMCFDINTLSIQNLQSIALDLNVPGYSQMTKEQLCSTLLSLTE